MSWLLAGAIAVATIPFASVAVWWLRSWRTDVRQIQAAAAVARRYGIPEDVVGKHDGHSPEAVTVPELLERAITRGEPLRLAWPEDDADDVPQLMRAFVPDEYPTGVLPRVLVDVPVVTTQHTAKSGCSTDLFRGDRDVHGR